MCKCAGLTLASNSKSSANQSRANRAQRLMKEAVEKSGRDNTTALVIEIA
jgi:serine/threonine protein phosphatase PrpC